VSRQAVEAKLQRGAGMTPSAAEYIAQETKNLQWYAFDRRTGEKVKGTLKELQEVVERG